MAEVLGAREAEDQRVLAGVLRYVREAAAQGQPLLGEVEIAERLQCPRKQVRDVLASLEMQGVVHRRQGAATTVDPVAMRMSVRFEDQLEYSVLLRQLGYASSVEVLSVEQTTLAGPTAGLLMRSTGALSSRTVKRWRADGRVAMLAFTTVPLPPGGEAGPVDLGESIYAAVRELWGEAVAWEVATPSAEVLSADDAELFEHPVGTPVLTLDIVGIGLSGQRLFHARELHDPSTVSYSIMRTVRPPKVFSTARYRM